MNQEKLKILQKYLPGPYTFLLKPKVNTKLAPQLLDKEKGTLGVRIPDHSFTLKLANVFQKPYTATSANISGLPGAKTPEEVENNLLKPTKKSRGVSIQPPPRWKVIFIDAGALTGIPSTVIDLTKNPPEVVRRGAGEWSLLK